MEQSTHPHTRQSMTGSRLRTASISPRGEITVDLRKQFAALVQPSELKRALVILSSLNPPRSLYTESKKNKNKQNITDSEAKLTVEVLSNCLRTLGSSNRSFVRKKSAKRQGLFVEAVEFAMETLTTMEKLASFGGTNLNVEHRNMFGCIDFKGNTTISPYIKLNGKAFCGEDNSYMDALIQFTVQRLGIKPPRMVVSAFGTTDNSDPITSDQSFRTLLKNGLQETPDIWVVTDGRNGGISKLIASVMMEIRGSGIDKNEQLYTIPVIAIAPWNKQVFNSRSNQNESGVYRQYAPVYESDLDKNHRLFLFIDGEGADHDDLAFRRLFIARMREVKFYHFKEWRFQHLKLVREREEDSDTFEAKGYMDDKNQHDHFLEGTTKIGTLELVVGGQSQRAFRLAQSAMHERTLSPLVLIQGSGGLADLLSYAYRYLHDPHPESANLNKWDFDALIRHVAEIYSTEETSQYNAAIMNIVAVDRKIVNFDLSKSNGDDLDSAFLRALINNMGAVNTADVGSEKNALSQFGHGENAAELQARYELHLNMLRYAIGFDRVEESEAQMDEVEHLFGRMSAEVDRRYPPTESPTALASRSPTLHRKITVETHRRVFHLGTEIYLTVDVHYGMALEWALTENKVNLVKCLVHKFNTYPEGGGMAEFLYGEKPMIREGEGYGTTLAELYEYESMADSSSAFYLGPILNLAEVFPRYLSKESPKQIENNIRVRSVWTLVTQILRNDSRARCDTHGGWAYEDLVRFKDTSSWPNGVRNLQDTLTSVGSRFYSVSNEEEITEALREDRTLESTYLHLMRESEEVRSLVAFQELMIWAVVMNRKELALYFWQMGGHAIANALIASTIYNGIANHQSIVTKGKMADVVERMTENSEEFEKHALGVMSICYSQDPALAQDILEHGLSEYAWLGNQYDCLELAESANNLDFVSHPACQAVIERKWKAKKSPTLVAYLKEQLRPETRFEKFTRKAQSPQNKFRLDVCAYMLFVVLLAFTSLEKIEVQTMSSAEWILCVWVSLLLFEELRQTLVLDEGEPYSFYALGLCIKEYWGDIWNKLDIFIFIVYYIAAGLRLSYPETNVVRDVKALYGVTMILATVRFSHFFNVLPGLGPKFLILGNLIPSLLHYLVLLLIFIVPYGVFIQSVINPFVPLAGESAFSDIMRVLYIPYFQMYGELMLEDLHAHSTCKGEYYLFDHCESGMQRALPVFLAGYMIITSVMIMNMLIADFTMTFERIFERQNAVWKMQLFKLVLEYETKTLVPAPCNFPVIILTMLYTLITSLVQCCCCKKTVLQRNNMSAMAEKEHAKIVEIFQDQLADAYFDEHEDKSTTDSNSRIENMMQKALAELEYFKSHQYSHAKRMEEKEARCDDSCMVSPTLQPHSSSQHVAIAYFARKYHSPNTYYTSQDNNMNELSWAQSTSPFPFSYNLFKNFWIQHYPSGPVVPSEQQATERWNTVFHQWALDGVVQKLQRGANKVVYHIVTRWKRNSSGIRIERSGKPLLEFVGVKRRPHSSHWSIPEMHNRLYTSEHNKLANKGMCVGSPTYMVAFHNENYKYNIQPKQRAHIDDDILKFLNSSDKTNVVYDGVVDDARNTGAAWYHATVTNFHDNGNILDAFDLKVVGKVHDVQMAEVAWLTLHNNVQMSSEQGFLLKRVAHRLNAYW
eukprot:m.229986 g.229986  ORF g.229986 m.229986 type:complete len:1663 (+) comp33568_c1_seq1:170-5158(+)